MAQKFLSIRNLEKYQTNRLKNPPWFKIHRTMFGDPEFIKLSPAYRFLYIGLIYLAVESGNRIYNDDQFLIQRLYIPTSNVYGTCTDGILKVYKGHTKLDLTPLYRSGLLYTTNLSRVLSETEGEGEGEREGEGETERDVVVVPRELSTTPKSEGVWTAYRDAYRGRYGVDPVRNRSVNIGLCQVIDKLGITDAPHVAAFYVGHNSQWYITKMHPVNLMVVDAEKLRTEWATGRQITVTHARQADGKATRGQMWKELIEECNQKEQTV